MYARNDENFVSPSEVIIPLPIDKDMLIDLNIRIIYGFRSSRQDLVLESLHRLPKFSTFELVKLRDIQESDSCLSFSIVERSNRVLLWINQSFTSTVELNNTTDSIVVAFQSLRDPTLTLVLRFNSENRNFQINTKSMDLAGSVVQDLCSYLGVCFYFFIF